jgi:hypothetical protein
MALEFGRYRLIDVRRNEIVMGATEYDFEASLDDIEKFLDRMKPR